MTTLSLIIPCYNESKNLPLLLDRCAEIVKHKKDVEIIIVDNGSTDDTPVVLDDLALKYPFIIRTRVDNNQGYGNGILAGLDVAKNDILAWTHADMQADPSDILIGVKKFECSSTPEELFVKGKLSFYKQFFWSTATLKLLYTDKYVARVRLHICMGPR